METKKSRPIGVIVLVCVVAIVVAALVYLRVSGIPGGTNEADAKKQVEAEIARIRAAGEPVSAADLRGPAIPDSENGAVVFAKAFKMAEGLDRYLKGDGYRALTSEDPSRRTPEVIAEARTMVAKYKAVFPLIEEAVAKSQCRFPVKWEQSYAAMFPHCAKLRQLSRLLSAKAVVEAHDGRAKEAVHTVELNMRMSDCLKDEPTIISQLVRVAVFAIAEKSLVVVSGQMKLDEASARHLHQTLDSLDFSKSITAAGLGERAMMLQYLRNYEATGELPDYSGAPEQSNQSSSWWAQRYLYTDIDYQLRRWKVMIDQSTTPYRTLVSNHSDVLSEPKPPFGCILAITMLPELGRFSAKRDGAIARLALCKATLALKLYESRHGQYPATLAEAARDTGLAIPEDPFSGKSLVYRKQGKGCMVYSIDEDLKDNGGAERVSYRGPDAKMPPGPPMPGAALPPGFDPSKMPPPPMPPGAPPMPPGAGPMPGPPMPPGMQAAEPYRTDYDIVVKLSNSRK